MEIVLFHQFQGCTVDGVAALVIFVGSLRFLLYNLKGGIYGAFVILLREIAYILHTV